ncbi:hypothetical protein [Candidatus Spyradosoma sp. SGI.093]|uniref:hypothetical protein n=1 Tax=Candidatus Spyradosoma sp. SGI.093 TaxID=3420583 RepID=UPI003CFFADD0
MRFFTFDYCNPASSSEYWRSSDGSVVPAYVKGIPGTISEKLDPIFCNDWRGSDRVAGMKIASGRACVFRLYDGGRDRRGRPHRWVIFAAEGAAEELAGTDVVAATESEAFSDFIARARAETIVPPEPEARWERRRHDAAPTEELPKGTTRFFGGDAEARVRRFSETLSLAGTDGWIFFEANAGRFRAWAETGTPSKPKFRTEDREREEPVPPDEPEARGWTSRICSATGTLVEDAGREGAPQEKRRVSRCCLAAAAIAAAFLILLGLAVVSVFRAFPECLDSLRHLLDRQPPCDAPKMCPLVLERTEEFVIFKIPKPLPESRFFEGRWKIFMKGEVERIEIWEITNPETERK